MSVIRVLQEDVWNDMYGWEDYLIKSIESARSGGARVFTPPDTREYTSSESAYVKMHDCRTSIFEAGIMIS